MSVEKAWRENLVAAKNLLSIFAIIVGAGWAGLQGYFNKHGSVGLNLDSVQFQSGERLARVRVDVQNDGYLPFDIPDSRLTLHILERVDAVNSIPERGERWYFPFPFHDQVLIHTDGTILPGTKETFWSEFLLDACVSVIMVRVASCAEYKQCFDGTTPRQVWTDQKVLELEGRERCESG